MEVFARMWVRSMQDTVPKQYGRNLMLWLLVCHIFRLHDTHRSLSMITVTQSPNLITSLGLPFLLSMIGNCFIRRSWIWKLIDSIETLNGKRESAISDIIDSLYSAIDHMFRFDTNGLPNDNNPAQDPCHSCTSRKLGALLKGMHAASLYPKPQYPFVGLSYGSLQVSLKNIKSFKDGAWTSRHGNCRSLAEMFSYMEWSLWPKLDEIIESHSWAICTGLMLWNTISDSRCYSFYLLVFSHRTGTNGFHPWT